MAANQLTLQIPTFLASGASSSTNLLGQTLPGVNLATPQAAAASAINAMAAIPQAAIGGVQTAINSLLSSMTTIGNQINQGLLGAFLTTGAALPTSTSVGTGVIF